MSICVYMYAFLLVCNYQIIFAVCSQDAKYICFKYINFIIIQITCGYFYHHNVYFLWSQCLNVLMYIYVFGCIWLIENISYWFLHYSLKGLFVKYYFQFQWCSMYNFVVATNTSYFYKSLKRPCKVVVVKGVKCFG